MTAAECGGLDISEIIYWADRITRRANARKSRR